MQTITLNELEAAINFWRHRSPSVGEEMRLCKEASSLATPYARMILEHRTELPLADLSDKAQDAYTAWRASLT